jgi:hypothetical protein
MRHPATLPGVRFWQGSLQPPVPRAPENGTIRPTSGSLLRTVYTVATRHALAPATVPDGGPGFDDHMTTPHARHKVGLVGCVARLFSHSLEHEKRPGIRVAFVSL